MKRVNPKQILLSKLGGPVTVWKRHILCTPRGVTFLKGNTLHSLFPITLVSKALKNWKNEIFGRKTGIRKKYKKCVVNRWLYLFIFYRDSRSRHSNDWLPTLLSLRGRAQNFEKLQQAHFKIFLFYLFQKMVTTTNINLS